MGTKRQNEELLEDEIDIQEPRMYKVVLHNDNFTTLDFVVAVLVNIFQKTPMEAIYITQKVHEEGRGDAGIYSKEIAEEKKAEVVELAKMAEFPLKCTVEVA